MCLSPASPHGPAGPGPQAEQSLTSLLGGGEPGRGLLVLRPPDEVPTSGAEALDLPRRRSPSRDAGVPGPSSAGLSCTLCAARARPSPAPAGT